ncbi:MAG TPA: hypothetical protein VGB30_02780 [bacterium]|jgi:hypothetical protein
MYYRVTAKFKTDTASDFLSKLTDGTIEDQDPDGPEIVASMKRAVVASDGTVHWTETCYCPTPLAHERATVLDFHFVDLRTEEIDEDPDLTGKPFMEYLNDLSAL